MSVLVPPAHILGNELEVPCADGHLRRYVNLDYAASTPVMASPASRSRGTRPGRSPRG